MTETISRKELYDLVWSNSMVALSKKYAISDNGLRKICKRMNIPLPGNGHWVKLQFGKRVRVKPLLIDDSVEQTITLTLRSDDEKLNAALENPKKKLLLEIQNDPRLSFTVPEKLNTKDPLILAAKVRLTGKEPRHSFNYQNTVECSRDELDIRVGVKHAGRALRFMDTLLKLLRDRGHGIIIQYDSTRAIVKGQELKIKFREKMKRVVVNDRSWGNTELYPTGVLCFRVDGYDGKEWKDGAGGESDESRRMLESYLAEILAWMELKADKDNEQDEYYQKQREERQRVERIEEELKERRVLELGSFRELLEKAERWHKAVRLREYIEEVERRGGMGGGAGGETAGVDEAISGDTANPINLSEWLAWARQKADWYDPFMETVDELLGEYRQINY